MDEYISIKIGMTPKGVYDPNVAYEALDTVQNDDGLWQSLHPMNRGNALVNGEHWVKIVNLIPVKESAQQADTAASRANTAADNAVAKATLADTAANNANEKASLANEKAGLANAKAALANEKAGLADAKAALANEKAGYAETKGNLANQMATLANEKATLANTKAGEADTAAIHAREVAEHPTYIGENGRWWKWNLTTHAYEDTGIGGSMELAEFSIEDGSLVMTI